MTTEPQVILDSFGAISATGVEFDHSSSTDLSATSNGRYVVMQFFSFYETSLRRAPLCCEMVNVDTKERKVIYLPIFAVRCHKRKPYFIFFLDNDNVVVLFETKSRNGLCLILVLAKLDIANSLITQGVIIGQPMLKFDPRSVIAFQYKTDIFLMLTQNNRLEIGRYDIGRRSVLRRNLEVDVHVKDGAAYNEKLYLLCFAGYLSADPCRILIVDLQNNYSFRFCTLEPDPLSGFPVSTNYSVDHIGSQICIFYCSPMGGTGRFWTLCLDTLQWKKIELNLNIDCNMNDPTIFCLPCGKIFLIGDCTITQSDRYHLLQFWLGVPRLEVLALETIRKHTRSIDPVQQLANKFTQLGLPSKFVSHLS